MRNFTRLFLEKTAAGLSGCCFLALALIFCLSLAAALSPAFSASGTPFAGNGTLGVSIAKTAAFTFVQAFFSALLALALGLIGAFFCARRDFPGRRFLLSLSSIPLSVSPLLIALGFVMFFGMSGAVNSFLMRAFALDAPPVTGLYSAAGVVVAHGFYNFPIAMRTCADAWGRLNSEQHDAAVMLGAGKFRVFRTVTLAQILPAVASSGIIVFLYSFFSFVIVLLFGGVGVSVLEVEIFQAARSSLDFGKAARLAIIETAIAMLAVFAYGLAEKRAAASRALGFAEAVRTRSKIRGTEALPAALFALLIAFFLLAPLFCVAAGAFTNGAQGYLARASEGFSFTFGNFSALFALRSFRSALLNTVLTALASAALSTASAFFFACAVKAADPLRKSVFLRVAPLLPMAVSSIVLGLGLARIMPQGRPFMLAFAQSALSWPLAFRQISAGLDSIPTATTEAARVFSPDSLYRVFSVYLPMALPNIASAFGFCFAASCGDTALPLVLALPGFDTLALYTYRLAGSYRFREACACGLALAAITIPVFAVTAGGFSKKRASRKKERQNA